MLNTPNTKGRTSQMTGMSTPYSENEVQNMQTPFTQENGDETDIRKRQPPNKDLSASVNMDDIDMSDENNLNNGDLDKKPRNGRKLDPII